MKFHESRVGLHNINSRQLGFISNAQDLGAFELNSSGIIGLRKYVF